jgi:hypothetical protein
MAAMAAALWFAALMALLYLWPTDDNGNTTADAVTAAGVLATAGSVLWVGQTLDRRRP